MAMLREIHLTCPICHNAFRSLAALSTNASGAKRTDFHERAVGTPALPYLVHTCGRCAYSGCEEDFAGDTEIAPGVEGFVRGELAPKLARGPLTGSEKYELAAMVADRQGAAPRHIGDLMLRAAWCCVEEGDSEAERYFRRHTARTYERALADRPGVPRSARAVLTYLVGELWRRIGDPLKAVEWFDRVPGEVSDPVAQAWVVEAARRQRDEPREWFDERDAAASRGSRAA
jgi:uncharacterized protein